MKLSPFSRDRFPGLSMNEWGGCEEFLGWAWRCEGVHRPSWAFGRHREGVQS